MTNRIRECREKMGISQLELARRSGVSRATLSILENEPSKATSSKTMCAIARAMKVEISSIFLS